MKVLLSIKIKNALRGGSDFSVYYRGNKRNGGLSVTQNGVQWRCHIIGFPGGVGERIVKSAGEYAWTCIDQNTYEADGFLMGSILVAFLVPISASAGWYEIESVMVESKL